MFNFFQLYAAIDNSDLLIRSAAKGNPAQLSYHYKDLLPSLLENVRSPLAAPVLTKLFVDLQSTAFEGFLGDLIAHVTLRFLKPQCDLESAWEDEDLAKAMTRTIGLIHKSARLSAPAFCYTFSFIKSALLSSQAKKNENLVHDGLQIISEHAKMRGSDEMHPQYLPRKTMFNLLIELISKSSDSILTEFNSDL